MKIDGLFQKAEKKPEFSRDSVLHAVAEFIVCDDQVKSFSVLWSIDDNSYQSLVVANKTTFRNCLVAMRPASTTTELPSTHDITTYIHNAFIKLIESVKADIQVSFFHTCKCIFWCNLVHNYWPCRYISDLWSIDQTKASFLGLTAHWIEVKKNKWNLCSQVIAFHGVFGAHSGVNLGRYIVGLCKRVGIVSGQSTKVFLIIFCLQWLLLTSYTAQQLFTVTANNTSNNDTTCDKIEHVLHRRHIYSFSSSQHRLPCLAHVLNLAIVAIMSVISRIAAVETTTTIWEFDPLLPNNRVLGGSLDVVAAVRTIAIKVHLTFFYCYS